MSRRPLKFANLNEAVEDARRLKDAGYDKVGDWSLAQNLEHLNKTLQMAIDGPPFMLPALIRPILKRIVFRKMKRGDVIGFRIKAPDAVQPGNEVDVAEALAEFERLSELIESEDTVLSKMHPVFGTFSHEEWRIMQRWHATHHLSFLLPRANEARGV